MVLMFSDRLAINQEVRIYCTFASYGPSSLPSGEADCNESTMCREEPKGTLLWYCGTLLSYPLQLCCLQYEQ